MKTKPKGKQLKPKPKEDRQIGRETRLTLLQIESDTYPEVGTDERKAIVRRATRFIIHMEGEVIPPLEGSGFTITAHDLKQAVEIIQDLIRVAEAEEKKKVSASKTPTGSNADRK